jgi:galactose mutarotase-like enzyme
MTTAAVGPVALRAGALSAAVVADRSLQVTALAWEGEDLLVDAQALPPTGRVHGVLAGIPLLHPWANRLGGETFVVGGVEADVADSPVGRDARGLPIHGLPAAPGAWALTADGDTRAVARLTHAAVPAFPFAHALEVELMLEAARLTVATTLHATGDAPVPVAFGWHPYLRLPGTPRERWALALPARTRLLLDARGLPTGRTVPEPAERRALGADGYDDGFEGLADGARFVVAGGGQRIAVRMLEGYPAAQLFAPPSVDVVCAEPMTAPADALRSGRGLRLVAPGQSFTARFSVEVG